MNEVVDEQLVYLGVALVTEINTGGKSVVGWEGGGERGGKYRQLITSGLMDISQRLTFHSILHVLSEQCPHDLR